MNKLNYMFKIEATRTRVNALHKQEKQVTRTKSDRHLVFLSDHAEKKS